MGPTLQERIDSGLPFETDEGPRALIQADRRSVSSYNNYVCGYCWLHRLELFKGTVAGVHSPRERLQAFDDSQTRVFKVETIGDCYVAVCGLPDPRRITVVSWHASLVKR
jgi:hypothetical protein